MRRLSCPYCYLRITSALGFQCVGRGSPGHNGCVLRADPERERLTGFADPSRPYFAAPPGWPIGKVGLGWCPACKGESGIRACPHCHTPLTTNFGASRSPLVALVGAKGTGKSVFLTVLAHQLRGALRVRFDADIRPVGQSHSGFDTQLRRLDENVARLFDEQLLIDKTEQAANGRREPMVFEWRGSYRDLLRRKRYRTTYLSFYDTAGEDLSTQQLTHDLAYLGAADALILLLDPFSLPAARAVLQLPRQAVFATEKTIDVISRVTEKLRASNAVQPNRPIDIPIAVAFAKMDAFFPWLGSDHALVRARRERGFYDDVDGLDAHEHIRSLLHLWAADDVDTHLALNYSTYRYFGVSALGDPPDYETAQLRSGVRPHRVEDPLVWLLATFGVVPRSRR